MTWDLPDNVVGVRAVPLWGPAPAVQAPARTTRPSCARPSTSWPSRMARGDGEAQFLDALHQLYQLSREVPLAGALRTRESLEVLLGAMQESRTRATASSSLTWAR